MPKIKERRKEDRRNHSWPVQFLLDMHGGESRTSWMRWMGTFIVCNIIWMWVLCCLFDSDWKVNLTLEDMPLNLAGIIIGIVLGKVGQTAVERIGEKK